MRLLACSIIVLAGAISLGLGESAQRSGSDAKDMGLFLIVVGGIMFLLEYFRTWGNSEGKDAALARIEEARSLPRTIDVPDSMEQVV